MHHLEIAPDDEGELVSLKNGQPTRNGVQVRASQARTCFGVWERQPRLAKGLECLVVGFLIGTSITYLTVESTGAGPSGATPKSTKFHSSGFGGINNIAQPGGAKAHAAGLGLANDPDLFIPTSNLGREIQSIARENVINHRGHYVHDEHRSPYASHLYDRPKAALEEEQAKYVRKMEAVRQEWGAWSDIEDDDVIRPVADFSTVHYRDLPNSDLPENSWQTDEAYIGKLLPRGSSSSQSRHGGHLRRIRIPLEAKGWHGPLAGTKGRTRCQIPSCRAGTQWRRAVESQTWQRYRLVDKTCHGCIGTQIASRTYYE